MKVKEGLRLVRVFGDEWIARSQINAKERQKIVENVIQHIQALEEYKNHYEIYKKISTEQKEQIKSQASEIEKKDKRIKELKMLLEALEVQLEHCENAMLVEKDKLNAIKEVDNKLSKMEWTSRQARALRYEKEVKQILDDELPFTDLPKDYSDGEVEE